MSKPEVHQFRADTDRAHIVTICTTGDVPVRVYVNGKQVSGDEPPKLLFGCATDEKPVRTSDD